MQLHSGCLADDAALGRDMALVRHDIIVPSVADHAADRIKTHPTRGHATGAGVASQIGFLVRRPGCCSILFNQTVDNAWPHVLAFVFNHMVEHKEEGCGR